MLQACTSKNFNYPYPYSSSFYFSFVNQIPGEFYSGGNLKCGAGENEKGVLATPFPFE
jgi:hypothetical protein